MRELGELLRAHFAGWEAAILAGSPDAGLELGIRAERVHTLWNGALECRLLRLKISGSAEKQLLHKSRSARRCSAIASPRTSNSSRNGRRRSR
jgi:23S rRNA (guanine2445-N2)-methyltransferase / 23S rRNA (guanine2069-N7)-methyltransferase